VGKVSFLTAIKAWSSGSWLVCLVLGSVRVSHFHEAGVGLVQLVGVSLAAGSGVVKVHGDCRVVHVTRGVGQVVSLVWVPLGVPVVVRGVLLEALARPVVELTILKELVGGLASSSC
jgi:hypothetical protein